MAHDHHDHHHQPKLNSVSRAFLIGIGLNAVFVAVEIIAGFRTNSLALLTDAGHNLSDVGSLLLSLLAFGLAKLKANKRFTFGYKKTTILVSLLNAVFLLVAVGAILWETYDRIGRPVAVQGKTIAFVAFIGIVINSVSAYLFFRDKDKDINIKGAYLHLLADAMVSLGVVIGGLLMYYTGMYWIDIVLSGIIALVILYSTWGLLKESLYLSLNAVPENIDTDHIRELILKTAGVKDLHHLHVWAISTTQNALTAHLIIARETSMEQISSIRREIKHRLNHQNISHVTLETELESEPCTDIGC